MSARSARDSAESEVLEALANTLTLRQVTVIDEGITRLAWVASWIRSEDNTMATQQLDVADHLLIDALFDRLLAG